MQVVRISVVAALIVLIATFQNCAPQDFSLVQAASSNKTLAAYGSNEDGTIDVLLPEGQNIDGQIPDVVDGDTDSEAEEYSGADKDADKDVDSDEVASAESKKNCKDRKQAERQVAGRQPKKSVEADDGQLVACILVKNGKSLKLGLSDSELVGDTSAASSVCISQTACQQLVPQKFDVEGAYVRGYCNKNPNITRLSDAQVQELLGL